MVEPVDYHFISSIFSCVEIWEHLYENYDDQDVNMIQTLKSLEIRACSRCSREESIHLDHATV